jgi:prophage regulatory protein
LRLLTVVHAGLSVSGACPKFFADPRMCPDHNTRSCPKVRPVQDLNDRQAGRQALPWRLYIRPTFLRTRFARKICLRIQRDPTGTSTLQLPTVTCLLREIAVKQPSALPFQALDQGSSMFLRMPCVMRMTGLVRSATYGLTAQHQLLYPVRLGVRAVAWRCSTLNEWIQTRPAASH